MFVKLDIGPIKARLGAITAWPWREVAESSEWWIEGDMRDSIDGKYPPVILPNTADLYQPDIDFIAAAPSDVSALVAEVEQLRTILTKFVEDENTSIDQEIGYCVFCGDEKPLDVWTPIHPHTDTCPVLSARQLLGIAEP